ncbi:amidohydrolase family protein [Fusarium oxysporum f. sp. phaseoli]
MLANDSANTARNSIAYINGRVYTVNKTQPWAEAFIVDPNVKFGTVGKTSLVAAAAKAASMVTYDLKGRFVMPGIHDAHVHTIVSGSGLLNWAQTGSDPCLRGLDFRRRWFGFKNFDRSILDKDYPDTPIVLLGVGYHDWFTNTAALQRAGYNVEQGEEDLVGGKHELRQDGSLTGELKDQAGNRLMAALPKPAAAHVKRVVQRAILEMHRHGVTSCQDASSTEMLLSALSELEAENNLKMQFATHCLYKNEWLTGEIEVPADKLILNADKYRSRHVDTRFVKMMMDGACTPALMSHSDVDDNGIPDQSKILLPDAAELVERFDGRGMTCKIHCMGYGGARTALDAFEIVRQMRPDGPRHEVAHCTRVLPEDCKRFKQLNVTAEMSPAGMFDTSQSENLRLFQHDFERITAAGGHVTIGSDWSHGLELPMFRNTAILVRRIGAEKVLEMITLAGAVATGREKEAGSIEVGKIANFICVDRDLTREDFENAKVLQTWFEGEIVYDSKQELV